MPEPFQRAILHVDMDAFFAAVEQLDNPELRGKPVIVGGSPDSRGVVAAASYEARKFGVHSALPSSQARRKCPQGIFLAGRMGRYKEVSLAIREIFLRYTPAVEPISVDEAFLDVTGCQKLFGTPSEIARKLKKEIHEKIGLTASVGIAPNKFVAKIASDFDKPDGLVLVRAEDVLNFLAPLAVGRIWGVGKVTNRKLGELGIKTVADLRAWSEDALQNRFGSLGPHLYQLARGIDRREVKDRPPDKSISHEHTFAEDSDDLQVLAQTLLRLADKVAVRVRAQNLYGRVVQLKVRYANFSTVTRRRTLPRGICTAKEIHRIAVDLLRTRTDAGKRAVRLIGVGLSNFTEPKGEQGTLFDLSETGVNDSPAATAISTSIKPPRKTATSEEIERTTDAIRAKLGKNAIGRGSIYLTEPEDEKF